MGAASEALSTSELVLGRYRPLRPLGSGSSGSVWLARDERTGLEVALKVVPREGRVAQRAEREAGVAARLRHPRCQRIYEHAADSSHIYIAYEYVPGCTLREAMRGNRLTDRDTLEAAAQILEGLAHAHGKGIVHRDVKPANVILAHSPDISVRLLDFGLAQYEEAPTLTAVGDVPGTLAYISPERLRGEPGGPMSDVWAVGVVLWEALAGRHPFWAPSLPATAKKIEEGAPPLEQARPDLPKPVLALVARALAHDPAKRPSAADLARRLRAGTVGKVATVTRKRRGRRPPPTRLPVKPAPLAGKIVSAGLAALFAGWTAASLPFFPSVWPAAIALAAGAITLARARIGLTFALAVPILPLGNVSLGLAILYSAIAAGWLLLNLREPRAGLAFVAGPLLAPLGLLGLLPLVLQPVRGTARRACQAAGGVLVAAIVAGVRGASLPFTGGSAPPLSLHETSSPVTAASALAHTLSSPIVVEAILLAAVAAAIPYALRRGLAWIIGLSAVLLAGLLLGAPDVSAIPLVASAWITAVVLALQERGWRPPLSLPKVARLGFE